MSAFNMTPFIPNNQLREQEQAEAQETRDARERQGQPFLTGLAHDMREKWDASKAAKSSVEQDMLIDLRNRKGIYDPSKLAEIMVQGGSAIFMMLGEEKASAVTAWLKDIYFGSPNCKIWGTKTTPVPDLDPQKKAKIVEKCMMEAQGEMTALVEAEMKVEVQTRIANGEDPALVMQQAHAMAREKLSTMMMERMEEMAGEVQEAEQAAANKAENRIETKLDDILTESEFNKVMGLLIDDLNTFKCVIMKGPFQRSEKKLVWNKAQQAPGQGPGQSPANMPLGLPAPGQGAMENPAAMPQGQPAPGSGSPAPMPGGQMPGGQIPQGQPQGQLQGQPQGQPQGGQIPGQQPQQRPVGVDDVLTWVFDRVSPMDIYPLPDAENLNQGFFHRHRLTKGALYKMKKTPGFDPHAIDLVLSDYRQGALEWLNVAIDHTRHALEDRPDEWRKTGGKIDALQFWGDIQGLNLLQAGIDPAKIEDPLATYKAEVWLIDKYIIKAELNGNPLEKVPYHKTSFRRNNGSFWGKSTLGLFRDSIDACNATARHMLNNAAISSGPQVGVDYSQIREGDQVSAMHPWKIWGFDGLAAGGVAQKDPIRFFTPPSTTKELIQLYEFFSAQADEKTGVPKYAYGGTDKGGPLDTARGFTMMMNSVARGIKDVVRNLDEDIISPAIIYLYQMQLFYSDDQEWFNSDLNIVAMGSTSLIMKEAAAIRRNEFLAIAQSPLVMEIIGMEGFAEVLRGVTDGLDLPSGEIVPSKEAIARKAKMRMLTEQVEQGLTAQPGGTKEVPNNRKEAA